MAVLVGRVTHWVIAVDVSRRMEVRLAGAVVAGVGLVLFVGLVEGLLFPGVR